MVNALGGEKTVGVCTLGGQIRFVLTTFAADIRPPAADSLFKRAIQELEDAIRLREAPEIEKLHRE